MFWQKVLIERYLDNEVSDREYRYVIEQIKVNPEFAEEVELRKNVEHAISELPLMKALEKITWKRINTLKKHFNGLNLYR